MNATLSEALHALPVPDSRAARERTQMLAGEALASATETTASRRPRRLALGLAAAAGVAAFSIAPPGQSVADWVGERLGITETVAIEAPPGACGEYSLEANGDVGFEQGACDPGSVRQR